MDYESWIKESVPEAYGTCEKITQVMENTFPELRKVRGHYYCTTWGERQHWWLVDPMGNIVDPTASQFPSQGTGEYVEWVEGSPEPTGKCPYCGDHIYDGGQLCSDHCHDEYVAFCMGDD